MSAGDRDAGHLETVEDRAAAVVADDDLHAGLGSPGGSSERADIVQHREVAEQHARDARAPPAWLATAMPVAVAIVPSMPASPRLAWTGIFLPPSTWSATRTSRDEPKKSRSCGHVARHTASTSASRSSGRAHGRQLGRHRSETLGRVGRRRAPPTSGAGGVEVDGCRRPTPGASARATRDRSRPSATRDSVDGDCRAVEVQRLAGSAQRDHLDLGPREQGRRPRG